MEYRRRRKRKTDGPGMFGILVLLIVFALTAKIIAGSGAIAELKKRLGKSVVSGCAESSRETPGATFYAASPSPAPVPTGVTNRIDLPSLGFYAVQLGFYTSREKCELDAEEVRALGAAGYTVLFSTHEPNQALRCAGRVLALKDGSVLADGRPEDVLTEETLSALYGVPVAVRVSTTGATCVAVRLRPAVAALTSRIRPAR